MAPRLYTGDPTMRDPNSCLMTAVLKVGLQGRSQDGGGIGRGDHFLSYKFIERTIEQ